MSSKQAAITATKKWLDSLVIAFNFCPFARPVVESDKLMILVAESDSFESALFEFSAVCKSLDEDETIETALLVIPRNFEVFDDYLELLAAAQQLLEMSGYEGVYQLASFHPDYCFEGAADDDAANYTNRSPYPMLHLLREDSVERAISQHPNVNAIPAANIARSRELGVEKMRAILSSCLP